MHELPRKPMLAIAIVQGLFLYTLYYATATGSWPSESPIWSYPLWTVAFAVPLMLLLSVDRGNYKRVVKHVAVLACILTLLAIYTGFQAEPFGEFRLSSLSLAFGFSITLACFKALMYLQQRADQVPLSYQVLFTNSWRNFLVTALAALFVLAFWLILMLWGQLFKIIDIRFFSELFGNSWFIFPALSFSFGVGVIIFRGLTNVIDNIARLLHWLFKLLLPMVVVVAALFIAALPFVGLDALWSTGRGTSLLLWLLAITLFFTNAVYQDGREARPYPAIIHRLIFTGLGVMPIISALSFYGLIQRLLQYGWTVERCWAFVVWLILSLFAIGYVVGIVRRRDQWTNELARVNTVMGVVVLAIMLLANSPVLDFRKISLSSQLNRVESGEIELREFDFWYTDRHLARPGYLAMEEMKQNLGDSDPELLALIESPSNNHYGPNPRSNEEVWADMRYRPEAFSVPENLRTAIDTYVGAQYGDKATLFRVDLSGDGQYEYLLVATRDRYLATSYYFYRTDDGWQFGYLQQAPQIWSDDIEQQVESGEIQLVDPRFKSISIGDITFDPR